MERYLGSVRFLLRGAYRVFALPGARPLRRVRAVALARNHAYGVGHHERRVESHAELPDQFGEVLAAVFLQRLGERLCAAGGDRAQVLLHVGRAHAHAVVGNGQRLLVLVRDYVYAPFRIVGRYRLVRERQILRLVDRVAGVGHQFAQEYLFFRVERIYHQIEHLADFGLERPRLLRRRRLAGFRRRGFFFLAVPEHFFRFLLLVRSADLRNGRRLCHKNASGTREMSD